MERARVIEAPAEAPEPPAGESRRSYHSLSSSVAFQLRLAHAACFQAFVERAAEPDLRPGRFAILQLIADYPGIGQTELSQAAGRDKSTLTPTLADLERGGLVVRGHDERDRRARKLSLTPSGQAMLARLAKHAEAHDDHIDMILGSEREDLLRLLRKLIDGLDARSEGEG